MKKIYVISSHCQPRISLNLDSMMLGSRARHHMVSAFDLRALFNASKTGGLIACEKKEDALYIMHSLLQEHCAYPDLIEKEHLYLAVPVIYTMVFREEKLPEKETLIPRHLLNYSDKSTLSAYDALWDDESLYAPKPPNRKQNRVETRRINTLLNDYAKPISIYHLDNTMLALEQVTCAHYLTSDGETLEWMDLRPTTTKPNNSWFAFFSTITPPITLSEIVEYARKLV